MGYENVEKFPVQAPMTPLAPGPKAPGHPPLHDTPMERFDTPPVDPGPVESPSPAAETKKEK